MDRLEYKKVKYSFLFSIAFVSLLWLVHLTKITLNESLHFLGIYPRAAKGLPGILTMPFIHSDFKHLFGNSIPLIVMGTGLIYFYRSLSYRVFLIIWFIGGVCLWIGGRPSYHIGASGLVYGLASFLFVSGAIRRDARLAAISLIVVFLYGGMIWGVFPIWPAISWEGHLFGGLTGLACAIVFRNEGPQRPTYSWETEEEFDEKNEAEINENEREDDKQPSTNI